MSYSPKYPDLSEGAESRARHKFYGAQFHEFFYKLDKTPTSGERAITVQKARSQDIFPFETVLPLAIQNHGQRTGAPTLVR